MIFGKRSPFGAKWFVLIFAPPGNCKSLEQASFSIRLFNEYHATEKKHPELPKRILMTNQKLAPEIAKREEEHGHYLYWEDPMQLRYCPRKGDCFKCKPDDPDSVPSPAVHELHDVDLSIDEGATLFPSDGWTDTPMWLRKMWAQHRHNGIRILMLTQDYNGIDINCRRMLWDSFYMRKILGSRDISPTLPALYPWTIANVLNPYKSTVWGIYSKRRIDPTLMKSQATTILVDIKTNDDKRKAYQELKLLGAPSLHLITWKKCHFYDTTQNVKEYEVPLEIEHIEATCGGMTKDKKTGETIPCAYVHLRHKIK